MFTLDLSTQSDSNSLNPLLRRIPHVNPRKTPHLLIHDSPLLLDPGNIGRHLHVSEVPTVVRIEICPAVEAATPDYVEGDFGREDVEDDSVRLGDDLAQLMLDSFRGVEAVPDVEDRCEVGGSAGAENVRGVVSCTGALDIVYNAVEGPVGEEEGDFSDDSAVLSGLGCCTYCEVCLTTSFPL